MAPELEGVELRDRSAQVLELLQDWLTSPAQLETGLIDLIRALATAFSANGAGLAFFVDGIPVVRERRSELLPPSLPWTGQPDRLFQVRQARTALQIEDHASEVFLCTLLRSTDGQEWLLWLEGDKPGWTAREQAAFFLTGQVLSQQLHGEHPAEWTRPLDHAMVQRRLEDAAVLTRRLAHDYGNVLTSILGFTELSLSQVSGETALKRYLTEVHRGAQQGGVLTNRLRLFARRPNPTPHQTALNRVVPELQAKLMSQGPLVRHQLDFPSNLTPVAMAMDALLEVLQVFVENACEAVETGGQVTVTAREATVSTADCLELWGRPTTGPHLLVEVGDTGPGIPAEVQQRLFREMFFTNKPRHRGLGLAIAYGVLRSHRGGFRLKSRPGGTLAQIYLPLAASVPPGHEAEAKKEMALSPSASLPSPTSHRAPDSACLQTSILVVDDDPGILEMVSDTLRQVGYAVQTASSASEAIQKHAAFRKSKPFRLILSDIVMGPVSGVELARQLLTCDKDLRLLFMSGLVSPDIARRDFGDSRVDLLPKPFRVEGLLRAVRRALEGEPPRPVFRGA